MTISKRHPYCRVILAHLTAFDTSFSRQAASTPEFGLYPATLVEMIQAMVTG